MSPAPPVMHARSVNDDLHQSPEPRDSASPEVQ